MPLLVIQGEEDEYGTSAHVESIRERARASVKLETRMLLECGHSPQVERPRETFEAIVSFVNALP